MIVLVVVAVAVVVVAVAVVVVAVVVTVAAVVAWFIWLLVAGGLVVWGLIFLGGGLVGFSFMSTTVTETAVVLVKHQKSFNNLPFMSANSEIKKRWIYLVTLPIIQFGSSQPQLEEKHGERAYTAG